MRRLFICCAVLVCSLLFTPGAKAFETLLVYTSMKDSLMQELAVAFMRQHPEIRVEYYSSGAGKLMAKIADERQGGAILADVLWTSEVPDFYSLRDEGLLYRYSSPTLREVVNPFADFDGSFTAVRLGLIGLAYNTKRVATVPQSWNDLTQEQFRNCVSVANPALSGTAYMSLTLLTRQFGWPFIESLKKNGVRIGKGSSQVVQATAAGETAVTLAVDYITIAAINNGADIALVFPQEMLVVPSPIAIFKQSSNIETAKLFVDFMLSYTAQQIIARLGTLPVRPDVNVPQSYGLPTVTEAMQRAIPIDYSALIQEKKKFMKHFMSILVP